MGLGEPQLNLYSEKEERNKSIHMKIIIAILLMTISYFIGNISPATLLARAHGMDIKKEGSGNAGATNVLRVLGPKAAAITLVIDVLKGFLATTFGFFIAYAIAQRIFDPIFTPADSYATSVSAWCGLAVFIGHIWPILFGFKGGKGVATALGVLLSTDYRVALFCLGIFLIIVIATRMVSLGSIVAAIAFPFVFTWWLIKRGILPSGMGLNVFLYRAIPILLPLVLMAGILVFKHRENIKRIIKGEERKLSFTKNDNNLK